MATLYVSEFTRFAKDNGGGFAMNVGLDDGAATEQQVAIGGASAQSNAFQGTTKLVRVQADANCRIAFGTSPTASSTTRRLVAGATEYFGVIPGQKVAVITGS